MQDTMNHSRRSATFEYVRDDWEKSPKTDYTYANSVSYNKNYEEGYRIPNMSRPSIKPIRDTFSLDSSPSKDDSLPSSASTTTIYSLRNRNVVDKLVPMNAKVISEEEFGDQEMEKRRMETITMVSAGTSPMFQSKKSLSHLYGTDISDRESSKIKSKKNFLMSMIVTIVMATWKAVKYPFKVLFVRDGKEKLASYTQSTKRRRTENEDLYKTSGVPNSGSSNERFYTRNFFYTLIGTIGGVFYVAKNLITHVLGFSHKAVAGMDGAVLNRSHRARRSSGCCLPLLVVFTLLALGGAYLYSCGKLPSQEDAYDYGQSAWNVTKGYAESGYEMSMGQLIYLAQFLQEAGSKADDGEDAGHTIHQTITPVPVPSAPSSQPSPPPVCPSAATCPDMSDYEVRLKQLKESLDGFVGGSWKQEVSSEQEATKSKYEALKLEFDRLKLDFYGKMMDLKSWKEENVNEWNEKHARLEEKVDESLVTFKKKFIVEVEKQMESKRDATGTSFPAERRMWGEEDVRMVHESVDLYFQELFSDRGQSKWQESLLSWLSDKFVGKAELDRRLEVESKRISLELNESIDKKISASTTVSDEIKSLKTSFEASLSKTKEELVEKIKILPQPVQSSSDQYITSEVIKQAIKEALWKYDADKTGKADFALESAGGSVISTRCSKTYKKGMAQLSVFGIPLWYANNSPRSVIQPGNLPGECWPFVGSLGYVVVQLATEVHVTEVSIEHVSRNITTFGNIDSAPKEFSIWGLSDVYDYEGISLGNFTYQADSDTIQTFSIQPELQKLSFLYVELRVYSNHGNRDYTCLYRLRIHGHPFIRVEE